MVIIKNPIGDGLNVFRAPFTSVYQGADLHPPDKAVDRLNADIQDLASILLAALCILPAARLLPSNAGGIVRSDLLRLVSGITSDDFHLDQVKPLCTYQPMNRYGIV
ncbi:hypothetical protein N7463_006775 [Penicillium fimorum]|uniref:Uncharacterized protein n=1 Tax=Penicillium fimorum TaxID=1882269 RepID=A0A9X0C6X8_9EURO|nr:hypothetical protein N7463_006775 [Penicillium fimorum]